MTTNDTTAAKNAEISRRILAHVAAGMTLKAAFDAVLGEGRFDTMVGEVYDALRAAA